MKCAGGVTELRFGLRYGYGSRDGYGVSYGTGFYKNPYVRNPS